MMLPKFSSSSLTSFLLAGSYVSTPPRIEMPWFPSRIDRTRENMVPKDMIPCGWKLRFARFRQDPFYHPEVVVGRGAATQLRT